MNKKLLKVKQELEKVLFNMEDPDYAEIVYSEKDNSPKFTVCAEVGYNRLEEICDALNKVIQKYDDGAYFEPDVPGRADCYLWNFNLEDSIKDGYYDDDNFFCVTLNNMSKEDAKSYGKTFGLFIRPNRRKGYDLAGDEDQVRAMLEDYVGRYDEIGRIMNEGNYIPSYCREDFVNPHKRYADSKKIKDTDEPMYYGLFQRGGSIGANANAEYRRYGDGILLEVYLDKEEAKADAKRYRKNLTPGERSYYGMGYTVKPLNKSDLKNAYVQEMISKLGKNIVKDGKSCYPSCSKKKVKDGTDYDSGNYVEYEINYKYSDHNYDDTDTYDNLKEAKYAFQELAKSGKCEFVSLKEITYWYTDEDEPEEEEKELMYWDNDLNNTLKDSKKKVKDSVQEPVSEGAKEALEEYTQWYGIIGYDEDIIEVYESGCALVDDKFIDYEDSYDALDAYLKWEGIIGYTDAIYDILKNGVESVYYDSMLTDKESFEED